MATTAPPSPTTRPAIILVHGFRGAPIGLATIADYLRQAGYTVYTPAIPPFAGAAMSGDYTATNYAGFLADFIQAHQLEHPILIGHSMGSIIVAATAAAYPALINQKLVLLSPISHRPAALFAALTPLSALLPRSMIDYLTTRYLFVPHDRTLFQQALRLTRACSRNQPPKRKAVFAAARFSARHAITDFNLTQDVLIIAGAQDRLIKRSQTAKLANQLHAQTHFIANSGHLHNYEKPRETAELIINFLQH